MASLADCIFQTLARRGPAVALVVDDVTYSAEDIGARAHAVAAGLAARAVRPGDRVVVALPNSVDLVVTALGVLRCGAVLVPVNPGASAEEVIYIAGDAGARVAIVTAEHNAVLTEAALPELSLVLYAWEPGDHGAYAPPAIDAEAPALIVYTSGTTGRPKGAVLSHRALLSNLTTVAEAWRWTERDRLLLTLPCFHLHGLGLGLLTSFLIGSSVVLQRRFVAEEIFGALERWQATMFFGVPTMYNRLVALPESAASAHDLSRMRLWVSGSAPLMPSTFERFLQRHHVALMDRYGMTECGFVVATPYDGPRSPGVVGRPLPGISVRIVDPAAADAGEIVDVPDGTGGEIAIRGSSLFSGYWNRPEETRRVMLAGYLRSGDIGVREPDGRFRIVGRSSVDIIKSRGFKIGAGEIEDCLQRHPGVQEVAVVGLPDADQGERVVAAVTPAADAAVTVEDLVAFARQHLAHHKVPSQVVFVAEIPRTGPGKFKKKELMRLLTTGPAMVRNQVCRS